MIQFFQYYGRFQGFKGRIGGLPSWARVLLFVAALPGLLLAALSLVALLVSILALLVLTVPIYRLLSALLPGSVSPQANEQPEFVTANPNRRHVDVRIVE